MKYIKKSRHVEGTLGIEMYTFQLHLNVKC